jgi:predicted methyltransferase
MNDGHTISKTKSKRIAGRLRKYLKDGNVEAYESWYTRKISQLKEDDWNKSYPFSIDNVREFERFCENSGGFQIW